MSPYLLILKTVKITVIILTVISAVILVDVIDKTGSSFFTNFSQMTIYTVPLLLFFLILYFNLKELFSFTSDIKWFKLFIKGIVATIIFAVVIFLVFIYDCLGDECFGAAVYPIFFIFGGLIFTSIATISTYVIKRKNWLVNHYDYFEENRGVARKTNKIILLVVGMVLFAIFIFYLNIFLVGGILNLIINFIISLILFFIPNLQPPV